MHTPGGGGEGNFAFRFLRAKKKGVPRMLFTRGLAHSQVYGEGEGERLAIRAVRSIWTHGRET